jgi:DNA polymerase
MTLDELKTEYANCQRCELWRSRNQVVFGYGNPKARLLLLAERIGNTDDMTGIPFSGPAGDLLHKILAAPKVEILQDDVYITNMVLCRTPKDRAPHVGEMKACRDRLMNEIGLVNPKLIVVMGRIPMQYFLGLKGNVEKQRGWYDVPQFGIKAFLTLNPASALYGEPPAIRQKKMMMYEDWQAIAKAYHSHLSASSALSNG